jgi:hypothetical protein
LTQRERIFSPSTLPVKVEQLIARPRRKKIKTQGEKIKTQREKISYIFPQLKYADTVTVGILDPIDLIFYRERASQPARSKRRKH